MCGLRVKLTYTFSVAGVPAPIFVSIVGLTPREIPSCLCITLQLKELCIGGDGINVGAEQQGTIMFMRNGVEKGDVKISKIYREEVFLPFVQR